MDGEAFICGLFVGVVLYWFCREYFRDNVR